MGLEQIIQENTLAIHQLIEVMANGLAQIPAVQLGIQAANETAAAIEESKAEVKTEPKKAKPKAEVKEEPKAEEAAPSVDYELVKTAITKLASARSRDVIIGLLADFGAAKGPDLKPEQYADFLNKANALLEA